jgi:signal transduction histidine kinase
LSVLIVFIAIALGQSLVRPIDKLKKGAEAFEGGNFQYRIRPKSTDEIGKVAWTFDHMAEALNQEFYNRELTVKQRTEELRQRLEDLETFNKAAVGREERIMELKQEVNELARGLEKIPPYDLSGAEPEKTDVDNGTQSGGRETFQAQARVALNMMQDAQLERDKARHQERRAVQAEQAMEEKAQELKQKNMEIEEKNRQMEEREITLLSLSEDLRARRKTLEKQKEELSRSNKELDDFAFIASHDLKEPLRGIQNYANFLMEDYSDKLDEEGRKKLTTLGRLTKRLENLIDNLLHYSRLGRAELQLEEAEPLELLNQAQEMLLNLIQNPKVFLLTPESFPKIRCDKILVVEIFTNLIGNAIKYNDRDSKVIEVGVKKDMRHETWDMSREGEKNVMSQASCDMSKEGNKKDISKTEKTHDSPLMTRT